MDWKKHIWQTVNINKDWTIYYKNFDSDYDELTEDLVRMIFNDIEPWTKVVSVVRIR